MKGRYDNLHGDEPEIDTLAARAEATRPIDDEIDHKLGIMLMDSVYSQIDSAEAAKNERERMMRKYQTDITFMIETLSNLLRVSVNVNIIPSHSIDHVVLQATRLQALCREMVK